jgi:hypothetical protein
MSEHAMIHVIGVTAVWIIFLSSIRFALAGFQRLKPVARSIWRLLRCKGQDKVSCRKPLMASLDKQITDLLAAITAPWSAMLRFVGVALLGWAGISAGWTEFATL